jgi:hypothetical protein
MTYEELLAVFYAGDAVVSDCALLQQFIECAGFGIVEVKNDVDVEKLKGALSYIELGSNHPSGIPDEYDLWIQIMFALKESVERKEIDEVKAYELWIEWGDSAGGLDLKIAENKWNNTIGRGDISLGTIFYLAKEKGWQGRKSKSLTEEEWLNKERERRGIKVKIYATI